MTYVSHAYVALIASGIIHLLHKSPTRSSCTDGPSTLPLNSDKMEVQSGVTGQSISLGYFKPGYILA